MVEADENYACHDEAIEYTYVMVGPGPPPVITMLLLLPLFREYSEVVLINAGQTGERECGLHSFVFRPR